MSKSSVHVDVSFHDVTEIRVEHAKGASGRRWFVLQLVGQDDKVTEISVWAPDDKSPELVVEDDVSVRRVRTVNEEDEEERDV